MKADEELGPTDITTQEERVASAAESGRVVIRSGYSYTRDRLLAHINMPQSNDKTMQVLDDVMHVMDERSTFASNETRTVGSFNFIELAQSLRDLMPGGISLVRCQQSSMEPILAGLKKLVLINDCDIAENRIPNSVSKILAIDGPVEIDNVVDYLREALMNAPRIRRTALASPKHASSCPGICKNNPKATAVISSLLAGGLFLAVGLSTEEKIWPYFVTTLFWFVPFDLASRRLFYPKPRTILDSVYIGELTTRYIPRVVEPTEREIKEYNIFMTGTNFLLFSLASLIFSLIDPSSESTPLTPYGLISIVSSGIGLCVLCYSCRYAQPSEDSVRANTPVHR